MREIEFRGKRKNGGPWVYGMTLSHGTIKRKKDDIFFEISEERWVSVDPETVGQYTGLKDKNGVKIFEGDIIREPRHPIPFVYQVAWLDEGFRLAVYDKDTDTTRACCGMSMVTEQEVIGNIHDNLELLKEADNA